MQLHHPALNRLVQRDIVHEIITHLRPLETITAWLYCQGCTAEQIAEHLHCTQPNVTRIMVKATKRLSWRVDGARVLLQGRSQLPRTRRKRRAEPEDDYRTAELARNFQVSRETVKRWCRQGLFPNAYKKPISPKRSSWRIPAGDVDTFTRPQPGGDYRSAAYRARQQAN